MYSGFLWPVAVCRSQVVRMDPFHFWAGRHTRLPNLALVFRVLFSVVVFLGLLVNVCFCCVSSVPCRQVAWEELLRNDQLLCHVRYKTLTRPITRLWLVSAKGLFREMFKDCWIIHFRTCECILVVQKFKCMCECWVAVLNDCYLLLLRWSLWSRAWLICQNGNWFRIGLSEISTLCAKLKPVLQIWWNLLHCWLPQFNRWNRDCLWRSYNVSELW